ncbi:MAG: hypothetical protein WBQ44_07000 [Rhodococcus sp. (in: high G+C Gram-positive bacteria)]
MSTYSSDERPDVDILREVLGAVGGRPALAPVRAAASALLAEMNTAGAGESPSAVPPGEVPDLDVPHVPHVTRPRVDQPLGDPPLGSVPGDPSLGIVDAEFVDAELVDNRIDGAIGGGLSSGNTGSESPTGFTDGGVPTWDAVRERVENRTTTAMGREELDHGTPAGRTLDEQWNEREAAGRAKLDEIRRAMKDR